MRAPQTRQRQVLGLLAMGIAAFVPASDAVAGTASLYTCQSPSGGAAPTTNWAASQDGTASGVSFFNDDCGSNAGLRAQMNPLVTYGSWQGRQTYTAPSDTQITAVRLWRSWARTQGPSSGGASSTLRYFTEADSLRESGMYTNQALASGGDSAQRLTAANLYDLSLPAPRAKFGFEVICEGVGGSCTNTGTVFYLWGMRAAVVDALDPTSSNVSGSLTAAGAHTGTDLVGYDTADRGLGVYRSLIEVDGSVVKAEVVDANGGLCQDAGEDASTPYEFKSGGAPCRLTKQVAQSLDTRTVAEGAHVLRVLVEDASGNRSVVLQTNSFLVDNVPDSGGPGGIENPAPGGGSPASSPRPRGEENGVGASERAKLVAFSKASRTSLLLRYGQAAALQGRLTDENGRAIRGAQVEVLTQPKGGSLFERESIATTDKDGRYEYRVSTGPSRTIRFAYRAYTGDRDFADTTDITVAVQAGLALRRNPRKLRNGETVRFAGRLLGGPVPSRGVLVDLQARVGRHWRTFAVMRTQPNGRYQYVYRFTRTVQTLTYKFRARARGDSAYPYELGNSNRVRVKVRGG